MTKSEILKDLICLSFEADPGDIRISLSDALGLYADLLLAEHAAAQRKAAKADAPKKEDKPAPAPRERERERESKTAPAPFTGVGAQEKKEIYARLLKYREVKGVGCLQAIETAANGAVTADEVRAMLNAERYPLAKWQALGAALAHCGG